MKRSKRVVRYTDAAHDDFAGTGVRACEVTADFDFAPKSLLFRVSSFLLYYVVAMPLIWFYCHIILGWRIKNRRALRGIGGAYFVYANHSHYSDAFLSPLVTFPRRSYVVTSPDAVSIKGIRWLVRLLGAIPIPTAPSAAKRYMRAVSQRIDENACVGVFPEAHIWPFCTFLRPFGSAAFHYPVMKNRPAVAVAVTYQRRKGLFAAFGTPKRTIYISEPFYPDEALAPKAAQRKLCSQVSDFLAQTLAARSDYAYVEYIDASGRDERLDDESRAV
ncbi:MAG: lysophospholipid acyltransferase family protein [Clostridia bacterium]|nr:lysophospholipid acyltransferase family protein [Clostridia bacterium]